eukprot:scaffold17822_cov109-Amphora_coffeaeformis.AAC.1
MEEGEKYHSSSYRTDYHGLWHATFQPTPPIQALIQQQLQELNINPNQYIGVGTVLVWEASVTKTKPKPFVALTHYSKVTTALCILLEETISGASNWIFWNERTVKCTLLIARETLDDFKSQITIGCTFITSVWVPSTKQER